MKLTKDVLFRLITETLTEAEEESDEGEGLGKGSGTSAGEFKKDLTKQASKAGEEFSGITNAERKVFQQVTDILKKYAQVDNLAAGKALSLLKRMVEPFEKVIKNTEGE